jgi:hypothetical protein
VELSTRLRHKESGVFHEGEPSEDQEYEVRALLFLFKLLSKDTGEQIDVRNDGNGSRPKCTVTLWSPQAAVNVWLDELSNSPEDGFGAPWSLLDMTPGYSNIIV